MITGDNPLTACQVSVDLNITNKPILVLTEVEDKKGLDYYVNDVIKNIDTVEWISVDEAKKYPLTISKFNEIKDSYDFCITGSTLQNFVSDSALKKLLVEVKVFARVNPDQKVRFVSLFIIFYCRN